MARRPRKSRAARKPRQPKERALAGTGSIVTNFRKASRANLKGATLHQIKRDPDGWSAIDLDRGHLNEVWIGSGMHILNDVNDYMRDVKEPKFKNTSASSFCTIILGASPEYFRPDGGKPGDENPERLNAWKAATKTWISETFGEDLVSAIYNGDETTPHVHLAICPTYKKRPRKPDGRRKKGETEEDYQLRVEHWKTSEGEKTLSWSSNAVLGQFNSFGVLRESYAKAMKHLGLEYSLASFDPDIYPQPTNKKEHITEVEKQQSEELALLREERRQIAQEREALKVAQAQALEALENGGEAVRHLAEQLITKAEEGAINIRAQAEADVLRLAEQQVEVWENRLTILTQREKNVEADKKRFEAQMGWIAHAVANIRQALDAALAGTFTEPLKRKSLPVSDATDALFAMYENKPNEGDAFEFKATHFDTGQPIPLPAKLKHVIVSAFSSIREFAISIVLQQREARDLEQTIRDLKKARELANNRLTPAVNHLKAAKKKLEETRQEQQRARDQNSQLAKEISQYSQTLERLRPAYNSLQDWLDHVNTIASTDRDHDEAQKWIKGWQSPGGVILDNFPHQLTAELQDDAFRKLFCAELQSSAVTCDLSSADIRERWKHLNVGDSDMLDSLKVIHARLNESRPALDKNDPTLVKSLALEIARARQQRVHSIPELAKQFLEIPAELQKASKVAFEVSNTM